MLDITLQYSHSTTRFHCYEYSDGEVIFKVWMRHSEQVKGQWRKLPDPTSMDVHFEFDDVQSRKRREQTKQPREENGRQ